VDLTNVPNDQFKTASSSNGNYLKLDYQLLVRIEGAQMAFSFKCAGKEYASVEADFGK
jgi:hypothetical protein